jgi:hypothetical protein
MKVLISPNEATLNPNTNEPLGARVCDVVDAEFEVASPLFWVDCSDGVSGNTHFYDLNSKTFGLIPEYVPPPQPVAQGVQTL